MEDDTAPTLCMVPDCGMEAAPPRWSIRSAEVRLCWRHGDQFAHSWPLKPEPRRCIYVARKPGDGRPSEVKVGTTDDLPRRMKQLGLVPMTAWWGTFEEEHELHGWLRRDRLHGEWFVYTERTERTVDTWALEPDPDGLLLLVLAEPENARARWLAPRREEAKRRREAASKAEAA